MAGNYRINRSNYTIKKRHKGFNNGSTVFERDFMTTTNLGSFDGGAFPLGEHNFKMVYRESSKKTRLHSYGKWLKKPDNEEFWTKKDVNGTETQKQTENNIHLKPNYSSLLDFAYYGSATALIESSIKHIIAFYPSQIKVTSEEKKYTDGETDENGDYIYHTLGEKCAEINSPVIVSNPYNIDIVSNKCKDDVENPLRYFCKSCGDYGIYYGGEFVTCATEWSVVKYGNKNCYKNGDVMAKVHICDITYGEEETYPFDIYQIYLNGEGILVTDASFSGTLIRPTIEVVEAFFNSLSDFEAMMLNRETNPMFTMKLDTPYETENGYRISKRNYTWASSDGWNPDIEGYDYDDYLGKLIKLAAFYDEYYSNNMWNHLIHESIKKLDRTYTVDSRDEDEDDVKIGVGKMEGFIQSCARLFDDIKRYTDNIKYSNRITYDENNNIPDYFLSDKLELNGWEVYSVINTLNKDAHTDILYSGKIKSYTPNDVNLRFMKNLALNSRSIMSRKGTQAGIEMLLGLFGLKSYNTARHTTFSYTFQDVNDSRIKRTVYDIKDVPFVDRKRVPYTKKKVNLMNLKASERGNFYDYKIEEFVSIAKNTEDDIIPYDRDYPIAQYNRLKKNWSDAELDGDGESDTSDKNLIGLPVQSVVLQKDGKIYKYLIPWHEKPTYLYDDTLYFQMYGGWGKRASKIINDELAPNVKKIFSNANFQIYEETCKYIHTVYSVKDLASFSVYTLKDNEIFYVHNLDDYKECFGEDLTDNVSNYFILKDKNFSKKYGTEEGENIGNGWVNIPVNDIKKASKDGLRVLYLNTITDERRGNNPHIGYGDYDGGESYLEHFRQFFKDDIEKDNFTDDAYDCQTGEFLSEIYNYGFGLTKQMDNAKCWFFSNEEALKGVEKLNKESNTGFSLGGFKTKKYWKYTDDTDYKGYYTYGTKYIPSDKASRVNIGALNKGWQETEISPFNMETQIDNDNTEAGSFSVINTKNLKITFYGKIVWNDEFATYLENAILPYLFQVIPSTTILEIAYEGEETVFGKTPMATAIGFTDDDNQAECVGAENSNLKVPVIMTFDDTGEYFEIPFSYDRVLIYEDGGTETATMSEKYQVYRDANTDMWPTEFTMNLGFYGLENKEYIVENNTIKLKQ